MKLKIRKIKPLFNSIVCTMDKYEEDVMSNGLIVGTKTKGTLKEYQKVVAKGPFVKDINVGDMVMINPARFAVVNHKHNPDNLMDNIQKDTTLISYQFDVVTIEDKDYLYLQDRDVMYVFEGEEIEDTIEIPENKIII